MAPQNPPKKVCLRFEPQAWRKVLCKNCFKTQLEHTATDSSGDSSSSTNTPDPNQKDIIRKCLGTAPLKDSYKLRHSASLENVSIAESNPASVSSDKNTAYISRRSMSPSLGDSGAVGSIFRPLTPSIIVRDKPTQKEKVSESILTIDKNLIEKNKLLGEENMSKKKDGSLTKDTKIEIGKTGDKSSPSTEGFRSNGCAAGGNINGSQQSQAKTADTTSQNTAKINSSEITKKLQDNKNNNSNINSKNSSNNNNNNNIHNNNNNNNSTNNNNINVDIAHRNITPTAPNNNNTTNSSLTHVDIKGKNDTTKSNNTSITAIKLNSKTAPGLLDSPNIEESSDEVARVAQTTAQINKDNNHNVHDGVLGDNNFSSFTQGQIEYGLISDSSKHDVINISDSFNRKIYDDKQGSFNSVLQHHNVFPNEDVINSGLDNPPTPAQFNYDGTQVIFGDNQFYATNSQLPPNFNDILQGNQQFFQNNLSNVHNYCNNNNSDNLKNDNNYLNNYQNVGYIDSGQQYYVNDDCNNNFLPITTDDNNLSPDLDATNAADFPHRNTFISDDAMTSYDFLRSEAIMEGKRLLLESLRERNTSLEGQCQQLEREKTALGELLTNKKLDYERMKEHFNASLADLESQVQRLHSEKVRLLDKLQLPESERSSLAAEENEIADLKKKLEEYEYRFTDVISENEDLKQEVRDLQLEMEELHDQFREEETLEFRELQKELEAAAKNCRILQFKLRKAERHNEQLENDRAIYEEKLRHFESCIQSSDDKRKNRMLEDELKSAKDANLRMHEENARLEEKRRRAIADYDKIKKSLNDSDSKRLCLQNEVDNMKHEINKLKEQIKFENRQEITPLLKTSSRNSVAADNTIINQLTKDLKDSLERETDLKEQLKFAEKEITTMRKKLTEMEGDNESMSLQIRKLTSTKSSKFTSKIKPELSSNDFDPEAQSEKEKELVLQLEVTEQEIFTLKRKVDELQQDNDNLLCAIKYLRTKLEQKEGTRCATPFGENKSTREILSRIGSMGSSSEVEVELKKQLDSNKKELHELKEKHILLLNESDSIVQNGKLLANKLSASEEECKKSKSEVEKLQLEIKRNEEKIKQLTKSSEKLEKINKEYSTIKVDKGVLEEEFKKVSKQFDDANKKITEFEKQKTTETELKKKFEKSEEKLRQQVEQLEEQLKQNKVDWSKEKQKIENDANVGCDIATKINRELSGLNESLMKEKDQLISEKDKLLREKNEVLKNFENLAEEKSKILKEKDQLVKEKTTLTSKIEQFNKEKDSKSEKHTELEKREKQLLEKISKLESTIEDNKKQLKDNKSKEESYSSKREKELTDEISQLKTTIEDYKSKLKTSKDNDTFVKREKKLQTEKENLEAQLEEMDLKVKELEKKNESLEKRRKKDVARREKDELEKTELQEEIQTLKEKYEKKLQKENEKRRRSEAFVEQSKGNELGMLSKLQKDIEDKDKMIEKLNKKLRKSEEALAKLEDKLNLTKSSAIPTNDSNNNYDVTNNSNNNNKDLNNSKDLQAQIKILQKEKEELIKNKENVSQLKVAIESEKIIWDKERTANEELNTKIAEKQKLITKLEKERDDYKERWRSEVIAKQKLETRLKQSGEPASTDTVSDSKKPSEDKKVNDFRNRFEKFGGMPRKSSTIPTTTTTTTATAAVATLSSDSTKSTSTTTTSSSSLNDEIKNLQKQLSESEAIRLSEKEELVEKMEKERKEKEKRIKSLTEENKNLKDKISERFAIFTEVIDKQFKTESETTDGKSKTPKKVIIPTVEPEKSSPSPSPEVEKPAKKSLSNSENSASTKSTNGDQKFSSISTRWSRPSISKY